MLGFFREILTFQFINGKRSFCNMQIKRLSREKNDGEQIPKTSFLDSSQSMLVFVVSNLGYAIHKIVLVLVCALRVVGL